MLTKRAPTTTPFPVHKVPSVARDVGSVPPGDPAGASQAVRAWLPHNPACDAPAWPNSHLVAVTDLTSVCKGRLRPRQHATQASVVVEWTAREATALRAASRMSLRAFAQRLGVVTATVTGRGRRMEKPLSLVAQEVLDRALKLAIDDVKNPLHATPSGHVRGPSLRASEPGTSTTTGR